MASSEGSVGVAVGSTRRVGGGLSVGPGVAAAGGRSWSQDRMEVWSRPLADGTVAVALFNRGLQPRRITARWSDVGLSGAQPVRDLWKRADLGSFTGGFEADVPSHGAVMIKVGKPGKIVLPMAGA